MRLGNRQEDKVGAHVCSELHGAHKVSLERLSIPCLALFMMITRGRARFSELHDAHKVWSASRALALFTMITLPLLLMSLFVARVGYVETIDPLHQVFLDQVKAVIAKEASQDALYELLKIATPTLNKHDILDTSTRTSAFHTLQLHVHPDSHPSSNTTSLYQDVQTFYDDCCDLVKTGKRTKDYGAGDDFPPHFHVRDKWPFLNLTTLSQESRGVQDDSLTALVITQCMNSRGAIAHGNMTENTFVTESMRKYTSVQAAFEHNGGSKYLTSIADIKKELFQNGPVVSTSFILDAFLAAAGESSPMTFLPSRIGQQHELLIVGWKLTTFAEVWLALPLNGQLDPIQIAFGNFGIDETCVAPKDSFENFPWQKGPYLDLSFSSKDWMGWDTMEVLINGSELQSLGRCFESGLIKAAGKDKEPFVIRDKNKLAHSRLYGLNDVALDEKKAMWKVSVSKLV